MVAVNDLVVHPRDNDLILGTHGRGIWILDNINPLQEWTPEILDSEGYLFTAEPAEQIRYRSEKGHEGNMIFRGANPASGALLDFWAGTEAEDVRLTILDSEGETAAQVPARARPGLNRATWNLRYSEPGQGENQPPRGPLVPPGSYTVRLEIGDSAFETPLEVREDPRIQVAPEIRLQWTADLLDLGELARDVTDEARRMGELIETMEETPPDSEALLEEARELQRQWNELRSRAGGLQREAEGWVGPLTADQESRRSYFRQMLETLGRETRDLEDRYGGGRP
jgi:hypothetical protein